MGFRTYSRQPSICAQVNRMMEESEDLERDKCDENGMEYIPIDPFLQREKFKLDLWNRLSESEKESWREVAQKTEGSDKMTE
jgi:TRAP-type C4-dicarboxylate transport system substrate-binding protein